MTQFPLLSLPSVALEHVVKLFDPFELFDLSQCSRKSVAVVRLAGTKRYKLSLDYNGVVVNEKYKFGTGICKNFDMLEKRKLLLANGKEIFVGSYRGCWDLRNFYFVDRDLGLQTILFRLAELFGCRIDSINTGKYFSGKIQRSIIGQVIEKQKEIRRLVIDKNLNENNLRWILDNLTITDYCRCEVSTSPEFGYEFKSYTRALSIHRSHWFKLDDLIAAAKFCVVIRLFESELKNKDIDVFMKAWSSGDFPTLQYLFVESDNLNERDQILGRVPAQWWDENGRFVREIIDGRSYRMNNGVKFRRDNGIEAEVEMNLEAYKKHFRLYVI